MGGCSWEDEAPWTSYWAGFEGGESGWLEKSLGDIMLGDSLMAW